jgi:hypothetical protein
MFVNGYVIAIAIFEGGFCMRHIFCDKIALGFAPKARVV